MSHTATGPVRGAVPRALLAGIATCGPAAGQCRRGNECKRERGRVKCLRRCLNTTVGDRTRVSSSTSPRHRIKSSQQSHAGSHRRRYTSRVPVLRLPRNLPLAAARLDRNRIENDSHVVACRCSGHPRPPVRRGVGARGEVPGQGQRVGQRHPARGPGRGLHHVYDHIAAADGRAGQDHRDGCHAERDGPRAGGRGGDGGERQHRLAAAPAPVGVAEEVRRHLRDQDHGIRVHEPLHDPAGHHGARDAGGHCGRGARGGGRPPEAGAAGVPHLKRSAAAEDGRGEGVGGQGRPGPRAAVLGGHGLPSGPAAVRLRVAHRHEPHRHHGHNHAVHAVRRRRARVRTERRVHGPRAERRPGRGGQRLRGLCHLLRAGLGVASRARFVTGKARCTGSVCAAC